MKVWKDVEQRSEKWFELRCGHPTASNFARLLTPTGKDSSQWHDYALELCAACIRPDEIQWEGNFHTDRGEALEPEAADEFSKIMGLELEAVGFVTRDDMVVGCSPDRLIVVNGEYVAGLEIKCPLSKIHAKYLVEGKLPEQYKGQVHGGMCVTGLNYWYFMSYCPGLNPFILRVDRDGYTEILSDALDRFLIFYADAYKKVMPILKKKEEVA